MLNFESFLDLPLIWFVLIATAILLYVLLDGFDLGVGALFPFAPSDQCRDRMMNSIAPFWDGNETWLVLSGGGLLAAFPAAYAILMPAYYIPIILMLLGLIFRGVAFEFRFKAEGKSRRLWDYSFHFGSLLAAFMQGVYIGSYVQGVSIKDGQFSGGAFDWLNAYSLMTGFAVVCGYALLGATWLVMKTDGETQRWARKCAGYVLGYVLLAIILVTISMPAMNSAIQTLWFRSPDIYFLMPLPLASLAVVVLIWRDLHSQREVRPFLLSMALFLLSYIGIGISLWPWIVPFEIDIWQAAAAPESHSLLLVGIVIMLPLVLAYTAYCYYVFRGKASHESAY